MKIPDQNSDKKKLFYKSIKILQKIVLVTSILLTVVWFIIALLSIKIRIDQYNHLNQFGNILIPIISWGCWLIFHMMEAIWRLKDLKYIPELMKKLEEIEKTGVAAVNSAIDFIKRAFNLQITHQLREKFPAQLLAGLRAIGFNLRNWESHLESQGGNNQSKLKDDLTINLWLRYMRTYFFEEAFDISRKEIVTNGRNFCFMLLATFEAFWESFKEQTLVYYAVTPVHPKDWYNWPHGHIKPRAYFEEEFIGIFWRTLREQLALAKQKNRKIEHGRFILSVHKGVKKQPFGWKLDTFEKIKTDLTNTQVFPAAVTISSIKNELPCFWQIYKWLNQRLVLPEEAGNDNQDRFIVPLFSSEWVLEDFRNATAVERNDIKRALTKLGVFVNKPYGVLLEIAKSLSSSKVEELIEKCKYNDEGGRCEKLWGEIRETIERLNKKESVVELIQDIHHYDVLLSEQKAHNQQDNLRKLLLAILHFRDCYWLNQGKWNKWPSIIDVFTQQLHSDPKYCQVVELQESHIEKWANKGVNLEFSIFGVKNSDTTVNWKLVVATDLDYPFKVCKIMVINSDSPHWDIYTSIIDGLLTNNKILDVENELKIWQLKPKE